MNIMFPQDPLYRGLAYILLGTILLFYVLGFIYTIMNFLFALLSIALIGKGFMLAGLDKPIVALYHKIMKKK
jgi:hypothetical protein